MRALFFSHSSHLLGAERSLLEIASGMVMLGHEVIVSVPGPGPLVAKLISVGSEVIYSPTYAWIGRLHWLPPVGVIRLIQARHSVAAISKTIGDLRPDVVVTNTAVLPAPSQAADALGIPHLWIVRESLGRNSQLRSMKSTSSIVKAIFERSAAVASISEYVDQGLLRYGKRQIRDIIRVQPTPGGGSGRRTSRLAGDGTGCGTLRILLPGHLSWEKGQHLALLALRRIRRSRPGADVQLRIVGSGGLGFTTLLKMLRTVLRLESRVQLTGWKDGLDDEYAAADVVLVSSANEAFGRVFVEALQWRRPVIAFRRGAAPTVLGLSGVYPDDHSARALAEAIRRVLAWSDADWLDIDAAMDRELTRLNSAPSQALAVTRALESILGAP